jgi:hypothetical protein
VGKVDGGPTERRQWQASAGGKPRRGRERAARWGRLKGPHRAKAITERYRSGRNGGASKASCRVTGTWVRIPPSPPTIKVTARLTCCLIRLYASFQPDYANIGKKDAAVEVVEVLAQIEGQADECWRRLQILEWPSNTAMWALLNGRDPNVENEQTIRGRPDGDRTISSDGGPLAGFCQTRWNCFCRRDLEAARRDLAFRLRFKLKRIGSI